MHFARSAGLIALVAAMLAGAPARAAAQTWRVVESDNLTVISDASERRVRSIAWQFEQMRSAIRRGTALGEREPRTPADRRRGAR